MASEPKTNRSTDDRERTGDENGHGFVADLPANARQVADAAGRGRGRGGEPAAGRRRHDS